MSLTKEIVEKENKRVPGDCNELHLHREGTFMRAYEWSAWLACRYLNEFKVNKRVFKGVEQPVAFIGFPETSLNKWVPEGADCQALDEKHLVVRLPGTIVTDELEQMAAAYAEWKDAIPLTESQKHQKGGKGDTLAAGTSFGSNPATLTSIMQRVLAFPVESKSPIECMTFLADIRQRLAQLF